MIAQLIRQDPAFRRMPFWVGMALVWAGVSASMAAWITARRGPVSIELAGVLSWAAVVLYILFGELRVRTHRFNLALPISAQALWMAHVLAVALTGLVVLVISAGVVGSSLVLMGKLVEATPIASPTLTVLGGFLVAGLLLAIAIVHAFRPEDQEVRVSVGSAVWSLLAATAPIGFALVLRPLGVAGVVIMFGLAAVTFAYAFRAIPDTFSVPTRVAHGAAAGAEAWETSQQPTGLWFSLRVVHGLTTCAKKPIAVFVIVPFSLLLGFMTSGAVGDEDSQRFAFPFMIVYTMMAITAFPIAKLGSIDWLPWSRRRTLALLVLPAFVLVMLGYGAGRLLDGVLNNGIGDKEALCFVRDRDSGDPRFCVALGACEIAWTGKVPEITTPEGETFTPWNKPVVKGLPVRIYFPYHVPSGSSVDFAATQISGAARALFGSEISPDEIASRYLRDVPDGEVPALTLQEDNPALRRGRGVFFPWMMGFVVVFWALLTLGYAHWLRGGVSERKRKFVGVVAIAIPMLFWILDFVLQVTELSEIAVRNAFLINLAQRAGETPLRVITVWLLSALLAWAFYRLVERRVERAELSMAPPSGATEATSG